MLQRAASNAYSWWWASHIRTKQSRWLEQSMQGNVLTILGFVHLNGLKRKIIKKFDGQKRKYEIILSKYESKVLKMKIVGKHDEKCNEHSF